MNYAYLYINRLTGQAQIDLFDQLKTSIKILKTLDPNHGSIHIFNSGDSEIIKFCEQQGCFSHYINTTRSYGGLIDILIEKINILKDFDADQEVTLLDIDTAFINPPSADLWHPNVAVLWSAEYYITQYRNLDKVLPLLPWPDIGIDFNPSYIMYNTGVVYIPKQYRTEICEKALWIVDKLNDGSYDPGDRYGNKLDEQIGLSIAIHDVFGKQGNIKTCEHFIHHYWEEKAKTDGNKWWK